VARYILSGPYRLNVCIHSHTVKGSIINYASQHEALGESGGAASHILNHGTVRRCVVTLMPDCFAPGKEFIMPIILESTINRTKYIM
jgi:hypothetical protein